ncbi:MAG: RNA polymerase sigma-54 factor [Oscillospiraceae bacterium]|nr:RNA polymerase sigma-54 factor [Oscillospiraceae bacterium]
MEQNQIQDQMDPLSAREAQYRWMLQMGAQELRAYLENMLHENPMLELEESGQQQEEDETKRKLEWLETADAQNKPYYEWDAGESGDPMSNYGAVREEENLAFYLEAQLRMLDLPDQVKRMARYLIGNLDDNGYLQESPAELAQDLNVSQKTVEKALHVVRSLEPAGVGASDLQDCLRLQLVRRGEKESSLAVQIVINYLAAVAERNMPFLIRHFNAGEEEVEEACQKIRSLNPRPGAEFSKRQNLAYLDPDVFVVKFPGHFEILTNEYFFPVLRISEEYRNLLRQTDDKEARDYLAARMRQAQWVILGMERRRAALLACTQAILTVQTQFFQKGPGNLVPFALQEAAARLSISKEEMEQTVRDKYLQCSSGVYPFSYFFPRVK